MGCASSAALPFLTGRGNQAVAAGSADQNGKPAYDLKNGEAFVTDKVKEVADSSAVQGVISGVVAAKDDIVEQVQGAGQAATEKISSIVEEVEEKIESVIGKASNAVEDVEERVKSAHEEVVEEVSDAVEAVEEKADEKADEIDELLAALPDESEIAAQSKVTAEELIEEATEEVKEDEMKD